jgi:hypothetical protein
MDRLIFTLAILGFSAIAFFVVILPELTAAIEAMKHVNAAMGH